MTHSKNPSATPEEAARSLQIMNLIETLTHEDLKALVYSFLRREENKPVLNNLLELTSKRV